MHRLIEYALAGLCENPARKRLKGRFQEQKAPPLAAEGRWVQNLLFEAGGEMIRKSQNKQNKNKLL